MSPARRLALVRGVHTAIYGVITVCVLVVLFAGATGIRGEWLWVALGLMSLEIVVFAGNGMKCPLTTLAAKYGARHGDRFDTYLPERITRHTVRIFAPLILLGLVLLAIRGWLGFGWRPWP